MIIMESVFPDYYFKILLSPPHIDEMNHKRFGIRECGMCVKILEILEILQIYILDNNNI